MNTLTVTADLGGHTSQVLLKPEERELWLTCFRSLFGPKRALVDELRAERDLGDATLVVSYDATRVTFYPDGRLRSDEDDIR